MEGSARGVVPRKGGLLSGRAVFQGSRDRVKRHMASKKATAKALPNGECLRSVMGGIIKVFPRIPLPRIFNQTLIFVDGVKVTY